MVTSLNNSIPARDFGYGGSVQSLGGKVTVTGTTPYNVKIGRAPAGAMLLNVITNIETALTGGTPTLGVGTASGGSQIVAAIPAAAGSTNSVPIAALVMPLADDTDIWVTVAGTGTLAGEAYVIVLFVKPVS